MSAPSLIALVVTAALCLGCYATVFVGPLWLAGVLAAGAIAATLWCLSSPLKDWPWPSTN